jgi:RimJ/RimL family protein N-acetyltransferase
METPSYLLSERFRLRPFALSDLEQVVRLDAEPEVMRFINGGLPVSANEWRDKIFPVIEGYAARYRGELGNWIAETRESGDFMGWFHLRPDKKDLENRRVLELGFRLLPSFWGQGVATELSRALIDKAFRELGAEEVFARTLQGNSASQKVLLKCGLSLVGRAVDEGMPGPDQVLLRYSLGREQWLGAS